MNCYKINVKSLSLSNRKETLDDNICLYKGDLFFIHSLDYYVFNTMNQYSKFILLERIFYKKLIFTKNDFGDLIELYDWTWINDINIINPIIDYGYTKYILSKSIQSLIDLEIIVDYTKEWNRENNIQTILSEIK